MMTDFFTLIPMDLSAVFNTAKPNQADLQTGGFSDHCYADDFLLYITLL